MNFTYVIITIIFLKFAKSIMFVIDPDNKKSKSLYCVYKDFKLDETVNMNYVVSGGYHRDNCMVHLSDPDNKPLYDRYDGNEGAKKFKIDKNGRYSLCFRPLHNGKIYLNIDFHSLEEIGHIREIANDSKF